MGHVKTHPELLHGEIIRLFKEKILGLLQRQTERNFTFNAGNVVHPTFEKLEVGTTVQFIKAIRDDGVQAHWVARRSGNVAVILSLATSHIGFHFKLCDLRSQDSRCAFSALRT
ncbi:hypothetical protein [Coxiella endosymbiont of Ornithodoros amblus]|uniref:hypothetical protein n=1 Tax=Coxiella endosymbiont of Ornithodoros amblus TaxID=1656166 RepID=UPI00244E3227|nr:hypothetical protein [Coxiella endosymbiont of Ornithodoros amblus]